MKKVFYLRHAKSSWSNANQLDIERPLNSRGKRDAPFIAAQLKAYLTSKNILLDSILCSSSERTKETISLFTSDSFTGVPVTYDRNLYHASESYLVECLYGLSDDEDCVLVCSHNPGTSYLSYQLGFGVNNIPTCGLYECTFNVNSWIDVSITNASKGIFLYPKMYQNENT